MRIKCLIGGLAALSLAVLFGSMSTEAKAQVSCFPVDATAGYPHNSSTLRCGQATQANTAAVLNAAGNPSSQIEGELRTAYQVPTVPPAAAQTPGIKFYVFDTPAEYLQNFPTAGGNPAPAQTDYGVTKFDAANRPIFIAIFQHNNQGAVNPTMAGATNRQMGRAMDALGGYILNGGIPRTPYQQFSASTLFTDQLNADWNAINLASPCIANGNGVFNGKADPTKAGTVYLCTGGTNGTGGVLGSAYAGKTNKQIIQAMWPNWSTSSGAFAEIFGYKAVNGPGDTGSIPFSQDAYIQPPSTFSCSVAFVQFAYGHGTIPKHTQTVTTDDLPAACPTIAASAVTTCVKLFNAGANGYFPDGHVLDCMPRPNAVASGLQATLTQLGGATLGEKQRLDNSQAIVLFGIR